MIINIDSGSGFCFGVIKAIEKAEEELSHCNELNCLGDIVHNTEEVSRLSTLGLNVIDHQQMEGHSNKPLLIRAHGEPPDTYIRAEELNIRVIDATCPVVLKLQQRVKTGWLEMKQKEGQVVIFGKQGHAEVVGLAGQTDNQAIIVSSLDQLDQIDPTKPLRLFSQTTMGLDDFSELREQIKSLLEKNGQEDFKAYDTICRQVSNRRDELTEFALKHDVVIFVSGKKSSNGKVLYDQCKSVNPLTFFVSNAKEINPDWFKNVSSVGICGATSTPRWLMENIATQIRIFEENCS